MARTIVAVGAAGPVILERARAVRADLIVLGRNGAHATGSAEIGSAARLVLRGTQMPALIVPSTGSLEPHRGRAGLGAA